MSSAVINNPEIGKSIIAGGIETNYQDHGQGDPIFLIHGSGPGVTAYANWRLTMPENWISLPVILIICFDTTGNNRFANFRIAHHCI